MKLSTPTIIIAIILSIALFFAGQYLWGNIFTALLPIVGDVKYFETSLAGQFINSLFFSLTIALIPIATILIWKFAPILKTQRKVLTVFIIVIAVTVSIIVRREMIRYQASQSQSTTFLYHTESSNPQPKTIESGIPVSKIYFEVFAFAGLVIGSVISFLSLRQRTK